jgi:AcrR family transcriptional regulator
MASPQSAQTRKARTDEKVFRATMELLRARGADAVTVEAVAAASGVAKTTIYRRHADRIALLRAALDHYLPRPDAISDADPRSGLTTLMRAVSTTIERYIGMSIAALVSAGRDPAAKVVIDGVIQPRMAQLTSLLEGWRQAGALRRDLDVDLTVATIFGTSGVTYARYRTFPPDWPERLVDHLWPLLRPDDRPHVDNPPPPPR